MQHQTCGQPASLQLAAQSLLKAALSSRCHLQPYCSPLTIPVLAQQTLGFLSKKGYEGRAAGLQLAA